MRVAIARTMPEFSMNVYTDGLISGLRIVRPDWEILDLVPEPIDRKSKSLLLRVRKYYERFWNFPRLVKRQKADIVHIIDAAEAHIVYWLCQTNHHTVVTCHDLINYFYADNRQASVQLPFISHKMWLYAIHGMTFADRIISVSNNTAKDTHQILHIEPSRITVVPNAVEQIFQPLPSIEIDSLYQKYEISSESLCLLNVGSDHQRKNLLNILKAVKILCDQALPIIFFKVGSDFTAEQQALIAEQQLNSCVRYLGKPDKATLVQIYNLADILVTPSLFEGFGMTILEAMACGTPVITSNVSSMPDVAGDAGLLIDPQSPEAIAREVERLYYDRDLYQTYVTKGLARVQSFTWEAAAEQVARVYENLVRPTTAS